MMEIFLEIVNRCIRIGLENNCSTLKKLSLLSYHQLKEYSIPSKYKLNAIAQAAGRLTQMKKDIKKGKRVKSPFVRKPYLVSCYGFKINGMLLSFPVKNRVCKYPAHRPYSIRTLKGWSKGKVIYHNPYITLNINTKRRY